MIEKRTIIDRIELSIDVIGPVQIRMRKQLVDGGNVIAELGYHRTAVAPGGDFDAQLAAVNGHLEADGFAAVTTAAWEKVKSAVDQVHTAAAIEAYRATQSSLAQ